MSYHNLLTVINTGNRGPELLLLEVRERVGGLLTSVWAIPLASVANNDILLRVGRVLKNVALAGLLALLNLADFVANADHSINETVKLLLALTLSRLNHERVRDGPAHGGSMEAVILETLGNINSLDARGLGEATGIDDELVGAATLVVGVENGVVLLETGKDVVGVEQSNGGGLAETSITHGRDVSPADGDDAGATVVGTGNGDLVLLVRQERLKVLLDTDGSNTRATTTVGNAEGLVQVQVADISTESARGGEANLSVHVGTVHVDLATVLVDELANLANLGLEDTVGARVGNHDGTEVISVFLALGLEISEIEVTSGSVTLDRDDAHASHSSRGGVGSVSGDGDEANVTLGLGVLLVELTDGTETSKFTLGTRVGLKRSSIHTGQSGKLAGSLSEELLVALDGVSKSVGVDVRDGFGANQLHLSSTVELHGARSERDHGVNQGEILGLEVVHVTEHLGFAVVGVEDGVGQELGLTANRFGEAVEDSLIGLSVTLFPELAGNFKVGIGLVLSGNDLESLDNARVRAKVEASRNSQNNLVGRPGLTRADVVVLEFAAESLAGNRVLEADGEGVGEDTALRVDRASNDVQAVVLGSSLEDTGVTQVADSHLTELVRTVVDGVHGGHVGKQSLSSADVASSLLTANVLLTSLESETESTVASSVLGDTNQTTGQTALAGVLGSHEGGVGTTVAERDTPSLRVTKGNIGAPFTRGGKEGQSRQVSGSTEEGALSVGNVSKLLEVLNTTVGVRVLDHDTEKVVTESLDRLVGVGSSEIHDLDVYAEALSTAVHDTDGGVVEEVRNDVGLAGALRTRSRDAVKRHGHGLGGSGTLIKQTSVGDGETGEVSDHGLEVEQRLKTALADFSLVGSVAGVPGRVLKDVALDDGRNLDGVVTTTVHPDLLFVVGVNGLELLGNASLSVSLGLDSLLGRKHDVLGNDLVEEAIKSLGTRTESLEHLLNVGVARTNVAGGEVQVRLKVIVLDLLHGLVAGLLLELSKGVASGTSILGLSGSRLRDAAKSSWGSGGEGRGAGSQGHGGSVDGTTAEDKTRGHSVARESIEWDLSIEAAGQCA